MKKASLVLTVVLIIFGFSGCYFSIRQTVKMPFNGDIQFHDITAVIPSDFIRDSTQSNDDMWVFEKKANKELIIIKRSDVFEDFDAYLDNYVRQLTEQGADSSRGEFLYTDAVLSKYYIDNVFCQEILFVYNDSCYAFALRGGSEEEFQDLLNDINTPDTSEATDGASAA